MPSESDKSWTLSELQEKLNQFEAELRQVGFKENTLHNYTGRSRTFLRWLAGDYRPQAPK